MPRQIKMKLMTNKAQCKLCGDVIESKHVHDFRQCKCGEIAVDGGLEYARRVAKDPSNLIDMSEEVELIINANF
jgi:tRNA(Ile2) C34 agmatinyltransferase TiaS